MVKPSISKNFPLDFNFVHISEIAWEVPGLFPLFLLTYAQVHGTLRHLTSIWWTASISHTFGGSIQFQRSCGSKLQFEGSCVEKVKRSTCDNSGTQGRGKKLITWLRLSRRDLRGDSFAILVRHLEIWESGHRKVLRGLRPNRILKGKLRKANLRTTRRWATGPIWARSSRRKEPAS